MALSCIISEINRDIGRKSQFLMHSTPPLGCPRQNIAVTFGLEKLELWVYTRRWNKLENIFTRFSFRHNTRTFDGRTDGRTDRQTATARRQGPRYA